jgi:hypothetical protein
MWMFKVPDCPPAEPREYPKGAFDVLSEEHDFAATNLDALRAMPEADRAELARWLWPEGEAATAQLVVAWLRGRTGAHGGGFTSADDVADAIECEFGHGSDKPVAEHPNPKEANG